ncbi:MAG: hypothetical protein AB7T22_00825 [Calditrichaceae bacterium]
MKKGLIEGFQSASDLTVEYTRIGRVKIDILGIRKEIEEKLVELGGRLYHKVVEENNRNAGPDDEMNKLIEEIKVLEGDLKKYQDQLKSIKKPNAGKQSD